MVLPIPPPKWAGRIVLVFYAWGLVSGLVIMVMLLGQRLVQWCREKGGW